MIKRHLKLFLILLFVTLLVNTIGISVYFSSGSIVALNVLDAAVLIGTLLFNNIYFANLSKKANQKKLSRSNYYYFREVKSVIWIGVYVHIFLSIVVILLSRLV